MPVILQGDLFVLLLADHAELPQALTALYRSASGQIGELNLFMGLASRVEDCGQYRRALGEARQALDVAESLRPASGLCDFSELGVLRLLQGIGDRTLIDDFVRQTLGPLIGTGRKQPLTLLRTLDALLQENANTFKAASRLQIHRNTLAQRIQRIEQQSGQSLDDPLFRMNAAVALLAWRMTQTCKEPA
ncbi:PucR C-terminal helix-turn-helix domain [Pseudomonas asplenii]|nr:PucR C-terminal helix-turn-helix domain [Pseudomonas fuscovaginae]